MLKSGRIKEEKSCAMKVIITGGLSTIFEEAIVGIDYNAPDLILEGLQFVYDNLLSSSSKSEGKGISNSISF